MRPLILTLILLLGESAWAQTTSTYTIQKSYPQVVAAVERVMNAPREKPFAVPNLPAVVEPLDVVSLKTDINPKSRTYKATIKIHKGALNLSHTVTVRGYATTYEVTAQIDIDWCGRCGMINRFAARRIIPKAEAKFLSMERAKVYEYARQMDTPEVELAQDSWAKVFVDAYRLLARAKELQ